jgi:hypothetical protein
MLTEEQLKKITLTADEFMNSAQPSTLIKDIEDSFRREYPSHLLDEIDRMNADTWNRLANIVVGSI